MKHIIISILFIFLSIRPSYAILNAPPPFPKTSSPVQHYLRDIYENVLPLLFQRTLFKTVQTTDATVTDIAAINVSTNEAIMIEVKVIGYESGGDRAFYHLEGLFYRAAGNVTQEGATTSLSTIESDANWAVTLNADTTNQTVDARVTGVAATTITWQAIIQYKKIK